MNYAYTALDARGATISERISADSEEQALKRLHDQGHVILSLAPDLTAGRAKQRRGSQLAFSIGRKKIKLEVVVGLSRELAIMIETGVSIMEALVLLRENAEQSAVRDALEVTHAELAGGRTLSQAMSSSPLLFPRLYVDMVRTAETGGSLDESLAQAADYLEASLEMRRKVSGAMTYPSVLLGVAGLVVTFMLTYLVPQFSALFTRMNADIPPATKALFALSAFLKTNWWTIPVGVAGAIVGTKTFLRVPAGRHAFNTVLLRVPMLGILITKIVTARVLRALGTLTASGVPLMLALETATQVANNSVFEAAMRNLSQSVERGNSLSDAITATRIFPPMVCQMVATGEKSGRLSPILLRVSSFYEKDIDARLKMLASVIEPLMIVILGVLVGFIAISIISPIYSLVESVK